MSNQYDLLVVGAGPAGYHAAIRASQLGLKTACVDAWIDRAGKPSLGGTCLNAGCIPSKALLESSEVYHRALHEFARHGVKLKGVEMDLAQMLKRKDEIVSAHTNGIAQLFKGFGVTALAGRAQLLGSGKVKVGDKEITAQHIILAAGSEPVELPIAKFDGKQVVDSWGALEFDEVPKQLGVIGAGVIGVELGSVWSRVGAKVTVLEALDSFLPMADKPIAREALKQFAKQGLDIQLSAKVLGANIKGKKVTVEYEQGGEKKKAEFDKLIVAVGRRPSSKGLAAAEVGLQLDAKGFIQVDAHWRTNVPNVYAVGDLIGGLMLAHKGMEEGIACVERIAGQAGHVNYDAVPSVIYTSPEIAWVGKTEEECKAAGREVRIGSFSFAINGRAKALEQAVGMVRMVADAKSDELLGVHMIGPYVSELIAEMVLAIEYKASSEDIARTMHAHPTLSEVVHEAALAVDNRTIHFVGRRKQ
ncbi:MAG: dihydrolipoyl dehydrogenase [Nevskiales bacterium]